MLHKLKGLKNRSLQSLFLRTSVMLIKNNSEKTIKSIDWAYVFFSANTQSEAGHLEFTSDEKIGPGKSKEINVMARKPPAQTISVYALDKREQQGLDGQVVIVRVEYAGGVFGNVHSERIEN